MRKHPGNTLGLLLVLTFAALTITVTAAQPVTAQDEPAGSRHESIFVVGGPFNVGEIIYPAAHDFDSGPGIDTCMSLGVPPGDTFTLALEWEALFDGPAGAGDMDLYIYLDSGCSESALLTSSFNSNEYTGERLEITPQVRNIGSSEAVAGVRIGRRSGRGNPGLLSLSVHTGLSRFLEHSSDGPPLSGPGGAPTFTSAGPFQIEENAGPGTHVGTVTAVDPQDDPLTFFELEADSGHPWFQVHPGTGLITVQDPGLLDREATDFLVYWIGVTDGVGASLTSVTIDISGVNDNAPIAVPGARVVGVDQSSPVALVGTDADVDPSQALSFTVTRPPANGTLSLPVPVSNSSAQVVFSPNPGYTGQDTFEFSVSDGLFTSLPATVTLDVTDSPVPTPAPTPPGGPISTPGASPTPPGATPGPGTPFPAGTVTPTPVTTAPPAGDPGGGTPGQPQEPPSTGSTPPIESVVPPTAPRTVSVTPGDGLAVFSWRRPLSSGGAPIEGYRFYNVNTAKTTLVSGDVTSAVIRGLENGTSYLFQVRAFNVAGPGDPVLVGPVTPVSPELQGIAVNASLHPDDSLTVWWSEPDSEQSREASSYTVTGDATGVIANLNANEPLFVNISGLEPESEHVFTVVAYDEGGEPVASGESPPVVLPPTFASLHDPLPAGSILVQLEPAARELLSVALAGVGGAHVQIGDNPAVVVIREGTASIYVAGSGLHRTAELPADLAVVTGKLALTVDVKQSPLAEIELSPGMRLTGGYEVVVDPTGLLFRLNAPSLEITAINGSPVSGFEAFRLERTPWSMGPAYSVSAVFSEVDDGEFLGVSVDLAWSGIETLSLHGEIVEFRVSRGWDERWQADVEPVLQRLVDGVVTGSSPATCGPTGEGPVLCTAELPAAEGQAATYRLGVADFAPPPTPSPVPVPSPVAAAPEPPAATPPSLVVVTEQDDVDPTAIPPSATSTLAPGPSPEPEPSPPGPDLPEPGGGLSPPITVLLAGLIGLVLIRGTFYTVGRIKG